MSNKITNIDRTLMKTAYLWSEMSYCRRRNVGCVIANDGRIISVGFNGTASGALNVCEVLEPGLSTDEICPACSGKTGTVDSTCKECKGSGFVIYIDKTRTSVIHAEANAILSCAAKGIPTAGCDLYVTTSPCIECAKMIVQSKIKRVFYSESYLDISPLTFLKECSVEVFQIP